MPSNEEGLFILSEADIHYENTDGFNGQCDCNCVDDCGECKW